MEGAPKRKDSHKLCHKPQQLLSTHLARVCMKTASPDERKAELPRAKESTEQWLCRGHTIDYLKLSKAISVEKCRWETVRFLQDEGFDVINAPIPEEMMEEPSTSHSAAIPSDVPTQSIVPAPELDSGSEESSDAPSANPTWQDCAASHLKAVRCTMQNMGLYERFPNNTPILQEFKRNLVESFNYLNCQQEIDNVARMLKYIQPEGDDITMDFLTKTAKTQEYLWRLQAAKLMPATILNYIKSMIRFVQFLRVKDFFNAQLRSRCDAYLSHLNVLRKPVSQKHTRLTCGKRFKLSNITSPEDAVAFANIMASIAAYSSDETPESGGRKRPRASSDSSKNDTKKDFAEFLQIFPVMLSGQPPSKVRRDNAGFPQGRSFSDKWRAVQFHKREEHLLSKFYRRQPTVDHVRKKIENEGWTTNYPSPDYIVSKWKPPKKSQVETNKDIRKSIEKQRWSGVAITDFEDARGEGVVATKTFLKGSVICDYHGALISEEEGHKLMANTTNKMDYLFFFKVGARHLCIDAQTFPCPCHPDKDTVGRKMKHSKKHPNVKPLHCVIKFRDEEKDTLLLVALRDISVGEELKINYGVDRKSFRGKGLDLEWLDE